MTIVSRTFFEFSIRDTFASGTCTVTSARRSSVPANIMRQLRARPIFREELGVAGEIMPRAIPPLLADRRSDKRIDFAVAGHSRAGFHILKRRVATLDARLGRTPRFGRELRNRQHPQRVGRDSFSRDATRPAPGLLSNARRLRASSAGRRSPRTTARSRDSKSTPPLSVAPRDRCPMDRPC